jgi:hypothetical protein
MWKASGLRDGKVPISASIFVQDYLRPAAVSAGVIFANGQWFNLHNLRHSLSNWLVNKRKVDPKTAAQGAFLSAVGLGSRLVQ